MQAILSPAAEREKHTVALSSVWAAVFLTGFKLTVGLATNSLGILSEAAHSGLDLVAALMTFLAVRVSSRPPDPDHHFGHGKVENLSALLETLLLLVTCVWIVYEAINRLFFKEAQVEASVWAFVVMGASILVDVGRSRALYRVARKHRSQALEADALHFSTDIWSSSVVILGLALVRLADLLPDYRAWLLRADAVSAMVVAGVVVSVSLRLGRRTVDALLDRAPSGLEERIRATVVQVANVRDVGRIRLRMAGPVTFVEVTISVEPGVPAGMAHEVATQVEESVSALCPPCDVIVHVEPAEPASGDIRGQVHALAAQAGLAVHDLRIHPIGDRHQIEMDLEVPEGLSLEEAHQLATALEHSLADRLGEKIEITTHIEVAPPLSAHPGEDITAQEGRLVEQVLAVAEAQQGLEGCHDVRVRRVDGALYVSLHCLCLSDRPIEEVHRLASELERRLHEAVPEVAHFLLHVEPAEEGEANRGSSSGRSDG